MIKDGPTDAPRGPRRSRGRPERPTIRAWRTDAQAQSSRRRRVPPARGDARVWSLRGRGWCWTALASALARRRLCARPAVPFLFFVQCFQRVEVDGNRARRTGLRAVELDLVDGRGEGDRPAVVARAVLPGPLPRAARRRRSPPAARVVAVVEATRDALLAAVVRPTTGLRSMGPASRPLVDSPLRAAALLGRRRIVPRDVARVARGRAARRSRRSRARDAWAERRKWDTDWQRRLFDAGYAGLHWPTEYGGRGASPTEQLIFYEETARARAPVRRRELRRHAARGPDAHRGGHRRAEGRRTSRRSCAATRCGARASPSRAPVPTSRRCARAPSATATTTCSTARRSGARSVRSPTSASSSCAPIPTRRSTAASRG